LVAICHLWFGSSRFSALGVFSLDEGFAPEPIIIMIMIISFIPVSKIHTN
jgi:hypothetical protein